MEPFEKKVVNLNVEPPPQIDRSAPVEIEPSPAEAASEQPIAQEPSPIPTVPPVADVDEFGVPWKNRAMEWKRKSDELVDKLPQMIDEKLSKVTQTQQQPQYSYEQLEVFKAQQQQAMGTDPNAAQNIAWAAREQMKIQQAENKKLFEEVTSTRDKAGQVEAQRQQSLSYVQNTYPEAFRHDAQGRPMAWDESHPLTQTIFGLMKNPELSNSPQGLAAAADIAYGRVARSQVPQLQAKVQQGKADVKQAQKLTLTEGSGKRVTLSEPPQQTAINTLKKTGSLKDAENAMGAILKLRGILSD